MSNEPTRVLIINNNSFDLCRFANIFIGDCKTREIKHYYENGSIDDRYASAEITIYCIPGVEICVGDEGSYGHGDDLWIPDLILHIDEADESLSYKYGCEEALVHLYYGAEENLESCRQQLIDKYKSMTDRPGIKNIIMIPIAAAIAQFAGGKVTQSIIDDLNKRTCWGCDHEQSLTCYDLIGCYCGFSKSICDLDSSFRGDIDKVFCRQMSDTHLHAIDISNALRYPDLNMEFDSGSLPTYEEFEEVFPLLDEDEALYYLAGALIGRDMEDILRTLTLFSDQSIIKAIDICRSDFLRMSYADNSRLHTPVVAGEISSYLDDAYIAAAITKIDDLPPINFIDIVTYGDSCFQSIYDNDDEHWDVLAPYCNFDPIHPTAAVSHLLQSKYKFMMLAAYLTRDELSAPEIVRRIISTFHEWDRYDLAGAFAIRLRSNAGFIPADRWFPDSGGNKRVNVLQKNLFLSLPEITISKMSPNVIDEMKKLGI